MVLIGLLAGYLLAQEKPAAQEKLATQEKADKLIGVLRAPAELVEYDPETFAVKQTIKVPSEAVEAPQSVAVNHQWQVLYQPDLELPLAETDVSTPQKIWLWNGKAAVELDSGVKYETAATGSNQAVTESAPRAFLSADGAHLYWFANSARRLQREGMDLSTATEWSGWRTDMSGGNREELGTIKLPECPCSAGACDETCPYGMAWAPEDGVATYFEMSQTVAGKAGTEYRASTLFREEGGKWTAVPITPPLRRVLDAAANGSVIVEAIPDTGCCGLSNQSDDSTIVHKGEAAITVFDERATYRNPDYDVSFFTSNAKLSADGAEIAMTIVSTGEASKAIQLTEDGQANPEESKQIRAALAELPAVEVKTVEEPSRRVAFVPHATLVGWLSQKEILIVQDHRLVVHNVTTGASRKSGIEVEDAPHVFLR